MKLSNLFKNIGVDCFIAIDPKICLVQMSTTLLNLVDIQFKKITGNKITLKNTGA